MVHSFNAYIFTAFSVPEIMQDAGDTKSKTEMFLGFTDFRGGIPKPNTYCKYLYSYELVLYIDLF